MSNSTVKLLQAAADIVGGASALAERLVVDEGLLLKYMTDTRELPDALLLRVVDIVLADRQAAGPPRAGVARPDLRGSPRH